MARPPLGDTVPDGSLGNDVVDCMIGATSDLNWSRILIDVSRVPALLPSAAAARVSTPTRRRASASCDGCTHSPGECLHLCRPPVPPARLLPRRDSKQDSAPASPTGCHPACSVATAEIRRRPPAWLLPAVPGTEVSQGQRGCRRVPHTPTGTSSTAVDRDGVWCVRGTPPRGSRRPPWRQAGFLLFCPFSACPSMVPSRPPSNAHASTRAQHAWTRPGREPAARPTHPARNHTQDSLREKAATSSIMRRLSSPRTWLGRARAMK